MDGAADLYERDFVRWSEDQAAALRAAAASGTNLALDWENLAEEIDSLGKSLRSELRNRLATIIEHLLKLAVSPAQDTRGGWIETIERERVQVDLLIEDNPSLRSALDERLAVADRQARRQLQASLANHGEWTAEARRRLADITHKVPEVVGSWLPEGVVRPDDR